MRRLMHVNVGGKTHNTVANLRLQRQHHVFTAMTKWSVAEISFHGCNVNNFHFQRRQHHTKASATCENAL